MIGPADGEPNVRLAGGGWGDQVGNGVWPVIPCLAISPHDGKLSPYGSHHQARLPLPIDPKFARFIISPLAKARSNTFTYICQKTGNRRAKPTHYPRVDLLADTPEGAYFVGRDD